MEIRGKIKKIKSLIVNLHKLKTKDQNKKALEFRADIEVQQGQNYIKLKVYGQLKVLLKEIKGQRTKLNFDQITKLKP